MSFAIAFSKTMQHEGGYSNLTIDPGKETYMGISRVFWPGWTGWETVDLWKMGEVNALARDEMLADHVRQFYRAQFWDRIRGDSLAAIDVDVACELFDASVNCGCHRAGEWFQTGLNMLNRHGRTYPDIPVDGVIGNTTISTLKRCMESRTGASAVNTNKKALLVCMRGERYLHYKRQSNHESFPGWFLRLAA